jgi:type VI secretion system secreted protein Hcp
MASDIFLNLDGIDGESRAQGHENEIDIESFSWGVSNSGSLASGSGGGAGKASFQDFHFEKRFDKASPSLMKACATGEHIREATLTCRKGGENQVEFLKIKLTDVLVSSYDSAGSSDGDRPGDSFALNFAKIEVTYAQQKADGSLATPITTGWDVKESKST